MTFAFLEPMARRMHLGAHRVARSFAGDGALPAFFIIGSQKSGTTSLFDYLTQSPQIAPAMRKEVHHFDRYEPPALDRYRSYFPSQKELERSGSITGEATPFYLFHPDAAERIAAAGLTPKLIAILRDPVERAMSHYAHECRKGREKAPFAEAIRCEGERLRHTTDRVLDRQHLTALREKSYASRGLYAKQLRRFESIFGRDRLLVLSLDALASNPQAVVAQCCKFLEVQLPVAPHFRIRNKHERADNLSEARAVLNGWFDEDLAQLRGYLPEADRWLTASGIADG